MSSKNKGGREVRKPKQPKKPAASATPASVVTSAVRRPTGKQPG